MMKNSKKRQESIWEHRVVFFIVILPHLQKFQQYQTQHSNFRKEKTVEVPRFYHGVKLHDFTRSIFN